MVEANRRVAAPGVKSEATSDAPIERGKLYFRQQILARMQVGNDTFDRWKRAGLKTHQPGTKCEFILGDELIDWIVSDAALPEPYESPHAAKNRQRRRKE